MQSNKYKNEYGNGDLPDSGLLRGILKELCELNTNYKENIRAIPETPTEAKTATPSEAKTKTKGR